MNQKLFRPENTQDYTPEELEYLNREWEHTVKNLNLDTDDPETYEMYAKAFQDEVARM